MMLTEEHIFRTSVVLTLACALAAVWFNFGIGSGFLLGGLTGSFAFRLLTVDGAKMLKDYQNGVLSQKGVRRRNWRNFLKRCSLYAGALTISVLSPYTNFLSTLGGLLLPRLAIYYHLIKGRVRHGD